MVLDEAQAIKNPGTESAKAARLLRGRNRLALSGTPVENHLGELWSIFEFLNPGMLGAASVFKLAGGAARNPSGRDAHPAGACAAAFHSAAHEGAGGARVAAEVRADDFLRTGAAAAQALQRTSPALSQCAAADGERQGAGEIENSGAGGAVAIAAGGLPSGD